MSLTRKWTLLTAVAVLAILAAGWFLLVSPKRGEAQELRDQAVSKQEANQRLVQQLEVLKAQQAELPKQRAVLAVMRKQIPDNPALPSLIRDLSAAGRKVGVSIDAMTPAEPVAAVAAQPVAPAPATTTGTEGSATEGSATEGAATTPAAPAAPALFQVPLTLDVTGSYFELEQFINKVEELQRAFLVTGFTVTEAGGAESGATGTVADPLAPAPGDLTLNLQGRVFISPAEAAAPAPQPTTAASAATGQ